MDIYPASSDVTIPSGFVSRMYRGWYHPQEITASVVNLDSLPRMRGIPGIVETPPAKGEVTPAAPPSEDFELEIWRALLRPSLHGAT